MPLSRISLLRLILKLMSTQHLRIPRLVTPLFGSPFYSVLNDKLLNSGCKNGRLLPRQIMHRHTPVWGRPQTHRLADYTHLLPVGIHRSLQTSPQAFQKFSERYVAHRVIGWLSCNWFGDSRVDLGDFKQPGISQLLWITVTLRSVRGSFCRRDTTQPMVEAQADGCDRRVALVCR